MKRTIGLGCLAALGMTVLLTTPALAANATIHVPSSFDPLLSDTRSGGHYEVQGSALRVTTQSNTSVDKVAEYVDTNVPLADLASSADPSLNLTNISGSIPPGFQLVVDFNNDGSADGILVGEPSSYGTDWWLSNGSAAFVKLGAPHTGGGSGSPWHGTLAEWNTNFPTAQVKAFGFSLGSGVKGDWLINSIEFNGTHYTFAADVVLTSKDQCKNGGWATSYPTIYKNQGDCVSSFAKNK